MIMALEGVEGSALHSGPSLNLGKTRYPLYRRLGGPQGRSGQVRKISLPTGIRSPNRPAGIPTTLPGRRRRILQNLVCESNFPSEYFPYECYVAHGRHLGTSLYHSSYHHQCIIRCISILSFNLRRNVPNCLLI
jgi:hypothetical protein